MKTIFKLTLSLTAAALMLFATARPATAQGLSSIKGHANNPLGQPITSGSVKISSDRSTTDDTKRTYAYSFPVNQNGDFNGSGIAPSNGYIVFLIDSAGKMIDYIDHLSFPSGQTTTVDFDMTRKEYMDKMTPQEKADLEAFKKKNADVMAGNAKVANLNALLTKARNEMKDNPDAAVADMQTATQAKPDETVLWITLGQAQQSSADVAYLASKRSGPPTDPDILQKYEASLSSFQKGIDLDLAKKTPTEATPKELGTAYNQLGQINGRLGKVPEASAAYDSAAKALPASAGQYYYNEAATFYNANKPDDAAAAADKSIAADPTRADTYYIKGQALIQKATVDPATNKIVAPPGCVEAYQKYLELAPTGPHAQDIKDILSGIGMTVTSTFKAPAAKKK